jgi:alkanesulfonate monooxygenase SsuD/methylene tetrahydromethanopterin reductase-like flavin-dependent oxidoreductase (luciferase family)
MKFSMIFEAQVEHGTPDVERQAIKNCVEQAVYAEEMGFDGVWAVEHHTLVEYSHMSAPEIFLTAVAAKTSRIRIGHAAVCMPFGYNHPARVAERAAMLDIISDGRLNLGAARGGTAQEMALCGVDPELTVPQLEEALRFIGHCWRGDPRTHWCQGRCRCHIRPFSWPVPIRRRSSGRLGTESGRWCSASAVPT